MEKLIDMSYLDNSPTLASKTPSCGSFFPFMQTKPMLWPISEPGMDNIFGF